MVVVVCVCVEGGRGGGGASVSGFSTFIQVIALRYVTMRACVHVCVCDRLPPPPHTHPMTHARERDRQTDTANTSKCLLYIYFLNTALLHSLVWNTSTFSNQHTHHDRITLWTNLSSMFADHTETQAAPPSKHHFPASSSWRKDVVNQCLEFGAAHSDGNHFSWYLSSWQI